MVSHTYIIPHSSQSCIMSIESAQPAVAAHAQDKESAIVSSEALDHILSMNETSRIIADKYLLMQEIGHGSQGKLFLANRLDNNELVVVKQLNISSIKTWKEYELFHREAEVLKSLDFDGVAKFYDAIECLEDDPPCSYIVQEYIKGVSLQKMLNDGHRFTQNDVYDILIQLLEIVQNLQRHDPPIIHRDIKPSNLMISAGKGNNLKVTVIDFGAVANPQLKGGGSTVAGTFGYMPPEQLTGKPVPASDIYAIGALAVQLFCGQSPADIPSKDFRLIFEPLMQDKPHELVSTLRQMLEPKVDDRLSDVAEIIRRFRNYQNGDFGQQTDKDKNNKSANGYAQKYEEKLKDVQCICEPGNLEIWQHLPDQTPRDVPIAYRPDQIENGYNSGIEYRQSIEKWKLTKNEFVFWKKPRTLTELFIVLTSWAFWIGFCGLFLIPLAFQGTASTFNIWPLLFCIIIIPIALIAHIILVAVYRNSAEDQEKSPFKAFENRIFNRRNLNIENANLAKQMLHNCLMYGRKSIATIVGIHYLPSNTVYFDESQSVSMCEDPRFAIEYKFNPPDDRRKEDLIHRFVTHIEPENHYQIGDPLPILYTIEEHYFYDTVYSMPYPVAVSDVAQYVDLVNWSSSKQTEVQEYPQNNLVDKLISDLKAATFDLEKRYLINSIRAYHYQNYDIKRILEQVFEILKDPGSTGVHSDCIQAILDVFALPTEGSYSPEKLNKETWVLNNAKQVSVLYANYLGVKPRSAESPSWQAVDTIISICNEYNHCTHLFVPELWDNMVDVHNDPIVSPKVKKLIYTYIQKAAHARDEMKAYAEKLVSP